MRVSVLVLFLALPVIPVQAQEDYRPGLLFREDWKEIPAEIPVSQKHVSNEELILTLYGPGHDSLKKSHHDRPADDPYYIWSGLCTGNWLVTLKHRTSYADLREFARIRWRSRQSGFRQMRIALKLADGTWLVSREADGPSKDWRIKEFNIADIQWYSLDIESITEMKPVPEPDLGQVDEIGFTDLMAGGRSNACSRLDWIEIYAHSVNR